MPTASEQDQEHGLQMSMPNQDDERHGLVAGELEILEEGVAPSVPFGFLVQEHLLPSSARQTLLFDLIGRNHSWSVSLPDGALTFGKQSCCACLPFSAWFARLPVNKICTFRIQVLGTIAPNGWLWSWVNPSFPDALTTAALELKKKHPLVPEFQVDAIESFSVNDAHALSLVAVGLTPGALGFYVGSKAGVVTFFMLTHDCNMILPQHTSVPNAFQEETPALIHFVLENMHRLGTPLQLNHLEHFLKNSMGVSRLTEPPSLPNREPAPAAFNMRNGDILTVQVHTNGTLKSMSCLVVSGRPDRD